MKSQKPLSRKENIVIQEMDNEVLVYDLGENRAVCLNETSALIWQACDGSRTPAEISEFVSKKLKTSASEDLVWLALDQLKKEKLIENGNDLPEHFAGMSRRDAIKKVGLSTLIALPVIMAVTAPNAFAGLSDCRIGPTCYCNLGGVPQPPTTANQICADLGAVGSPAICAGPPTGSCLCLVPAGTAQNGVGGAAPPLSYTGMCIKN